MSLELNKYIESKRKWIDTINNIQAKIFSLDKSNYSQVEETLLQTHFSSSYESTINFLDLVIIAMRSRPRNVDLYKNLLKCFEKTIQRYKINNQSFIKIHPQQPTFFMPSLFENHEDAKKENDNIDNINDELFNIILNDDINKFQYMLSHYDLLVNSTVDIDKTASFSFFPPKTRISFIDLAAYYSSIQIFKFLFLSNADINEETFSYAVFGGCYEIIHILEEKKKLKNQINEKHLIIAIQTHQHDIAEYIINNIGKSDVDYITPEVMSQSIEYYNLDFFVGHINEMVELLKTKGDELKNGDIPLSDLFSQLLFDSLRCRHVDILDILLHTPLLNVNIKNEIFEGIQGSIIHAAARMSNHLYMKYILNCDRININSLTHNLDDFLPKTSSSLMYSKGLTALHIAVLRGDIELVKIILQSNGGPNKTNKSNQMDEAVCLNKLNPNVVMPINNETPLHFACRNNSKEIIQILTNDPRVDPNIMRIPKFRFFDGKTPADISLLHFDLVSFKNIKRAGGKMSKQFLFVFIFQVALLLFSISHVTATVFKKANFNLYLTILEVGTILRFCFSSINDDIFDEV